jgi:hypothetical protein
MGLGIVALAIAGTGALLKGCSSTKPMIVPRPKWEDVYDAYKSFGPIQEGDDGAEHVLKAIINAIGGKEKNSDVQRVLEKIQRQTDSRERVEIFKKWLSEDSIWKGAEVIVKYPVVGTENRKIPLLNRINRNDGTLLRNGVYIILGSKTNKKHKSLVSLWVGAKKDVITGSNFIDENYNTGDLVNRGKYPSDYSKYEVFFWELEEDHPSQCGTTHVANVDCLYGNVCKIPRTRIQDVLGCCHVEVIRNKINSTSKLIGDIGPRLKELWDRYEDRLTIHSIDQDTTGMAGFGNDERNPNAEPGVSINIVKGMNKLKGDYFGLKAYEVIIHELFHNIDYLIAQDIGAVTSSGIYSQSRFSEDFGKNKIPAQEAHYPNFCWRLTKKFARLIDAETKMCLNDMEVKSIYESSNAGLIYIVHGGRNAGEEDHMYTATYSVKESDWINRTPLVDIKIRNYRRNLVETGPNKDPDCDQKDVYHCNLSNEAFANIAAAAIANRDTSKDTFIQMTEKLPDTCAYFIKMLDLICEMLKKLS